MTTTTTERRDGTIQFDETLAAALYSGFRQRSESHDHPHWANLPGGAQNTWRGIARDAIVLVEAAS